LIGHTFKMKKTCSVWLPLF